MKLAVKSILKHARFTLLTPYLKCNLFSSLQLMIFSKMHCVVAYYFEVHCNEQVGN